MEKTGNMVICSSCGSEFDRSQVRCPYCGTAYAPAEEEEYMGKLEGIRADLEEHKEDGDRSLKKKLGRTLGFTIAAVILIILILTGILSLSNRHEKDRAEQNKEEFMNKLGITEQQGDENE